MTTGSQLLIGMVSGLSLIAFAAVSTPAHDRAPDAVCELTLTTVPGGTRIEARVTPKAAMTGSYTLKLREKGRAGTATIDQSGDFSAARGDRLVLSEIELSTPAPRLDAEFTLRTGGKTFACPQRTAPTTL